MPRTPRRDYSTEFARRLRRSMSEAEARLWVYLRSGFRAKFRRQEPVGPYITDFCCYEARLVIEVDGDQHLDAAAYDERRDAYLESQGFATLRIPAGAVLTDIDAVCENVARVLAARLRRRPR